VTPYRPRPVSNVGLGLALGLAVFLVSGQRVRAALGDAAMASDVASPGAVALATPGVAATVYVSEGDWLGVIRAAHDLQADVERVAGSRPALSTGAVASGSNAVIVGTVGRSALIDALVASGKLDVGAIRGKWESFVVEVVSNPVPGMATALVIAGSDKRGSIYGIYEVSEQIGVSPWYWWADVPVRHHDSIYIAPIRKVEGEPAVRYRGIFLNDEAPALSGWTKEKFGGYNHEFYVRLFELLLRLRANYLWPAMWNNAFNEDDPENPRLADEYGIVMGTSHHEPMLRAQQEWKRHGTGPWNFADNADELTRFWTEGIRRNRDYESIVTIGMRGDGDLPMSQESNISLLEKIVGVQRGIISSQTGKDPTEVPQLWALYKEVQDYFEKGMRVPDDVTLLWCDDNWGNIRRLPTPAERLRPGGAGIYYHFDYVGGPRSYKWLGTYPITKVWEQMHLASQLGANRIWIVNVGDLKPMEFPIEFFLRYAWAPDKWPSERLGDFGRDWAAREFGPEHASDIAGIIAAYTKYNGRRKPEHVAPETYSLVDYGEADAVVADWERITNRAKEIEDELPAAARDAFYQLVLHPVAASATVTEINVAAARNRVYAVQGRASAAAWAGRTRDLFARDAALKVYWDTRLSGGKWDHFMDQTHLGYTSWQEPLSDVMPPVSEVHVSPGASLGVAIDGSEYAWPSNNGGAPPVLPELSTAGKGATWVEVFNRGLSPADYSAEASVPWVHVSPSHGTLGDDMRLAVTADWDSIPSGRTDVTVTVRSASGAVVRIRLPVANLGTLPVGFEEENGCVAIEAPHFSRAVNTNGVTWTVLDDFGRTVGGVTPFPVTAASQSPGGNSPRLEYDINLRSAGPLKIHAVLAPTLSYAPGHGLRFAVSLDDEAPEPEEYVSRVEEGGGGWAESVLNGVRDVKVSHAGVPPGHHVLKFWMIDPGVVLERLVVDAGGVRPSYLGPSESPQVLEK